MLSIERVLDGYKAKAFHLMLILAHGPSIVIRPFRSYLAAIGPEKSPHLSRIAARVEEGSKSPFVCFMLSHDPEDGILVVCLLENTTTKF